MKNIIRSIKSVGIAFFPASTFHTVETFKDEKLREEEAESLNGYPLQKIQISAKIFLKTLRLFIFSNYIFFENLGMKTIRNELMFESPRIFVAVEMSDKRAIR